MRNLAYFSGSIHDEMDLATIIPFSSPSLNWSKQHVRKCVRDMAVISLCVWVIRTMLDQVYTVVNQFVTVRELCLSTVWTLLRTPCNEVISETMFANNVCETMDYYRKLIEYGTRYKENIFVRRNSFDRIYSSIRLK